MLIAGLGGNCKDCLADMLYKYPKEELVFYTDLADDKNIPFFENHGFKVCKGADQLKVYLANYDKRFVSLLGNNYSRQKQVGSIAGLGGQPANYISPHALLNETLCSIHGTNTVIMDYVHISAGSVIDEGATIYSHTSIAHDVIVKKYAFVSAYCAISNSEIGEYTFVGLNTMIGPGVRIGKNCVIGANSYVKHNLPDNVIAAGSPAKIIGENITAV